MRQFNVLYRVSWTFLVAVFLTFGLAGCEGDDGAAGGAGPQGPVGPQGPAGNDGNDGNDGADATASIIPLESCGVCHSEGSFASAPAAHALDPIEMVSNVTFAEALGTLSISFDAEVDGVASEDFNSLQRVYVTEGTTNVNVVASATLTSNGGGNYTVDIDTAAAGLDTAVPSRYVLRVAGDNNERAYFYGDYPASPFAGPVAVSAQACTNCHGPEGIQVHGGGFQAADGGEPCLACHGVFAFGADRPSLGEVAHKFHSGIWEEDGEFVEVTYPTYMSNCSVCHSEEAQLTAVNAMPVSGEGCFTCHGSMDGWDFTAAGPNNDQNVTFHLTIENPETYNCGQCHGDNPETPDVVETGIARANVAAFHNDKIKNADEADALLGNDGILWNGEDTSVTEGAKFDWKIDNVADDGANLAVTWSASYDGAPVNVCNSTVAAGNPVFHDGGVDENGDEICRLRIYRSYAQGEDFIMGTSTSGAGQPGRADVCVSNTDCVDGVATTTIPVDGIDADVGRVALNGKPLVVSPAPEIMPTMVARAPTPTFDWLVGLGGPAEPRRGGLIVDTGKCVGCHVGTLYQHGGDRVDNVDTCLVCHNAAANEQYRRVAMGVDASEAYDGKVGETFEMKTMIHRIHAVNYDWDPLPDDRDTPDVVENVKYNPPYLVYRGRGIYAFANDVSQVPNWDVVSTEGCSETEISRGERLVFGGDPESTSSCQPHNFHSATYPRSLNECTACHTADPVIPDQTKAMASTVEAGGTAWENQLDDVLQGAATTSCVTCHAGGEARGHAYQNSWAPQAFPEGRQTIIDAVN